MEELVRNNNSNRGGVESEEYNITYSEVQALKRSVDSVCGCISNIGNKIDALIAVQEKFTRWLLIVVCIIALGRGLIELGKEIFFKETHIRSALEFNHFV